jgi:hypothetical protein
MASIGIFLGVAVCGWRLLGVLVHCEAGGHDSRGPMAGVPLSLRSVRCDLVPGGADGG